MHPHRDLHLMESVGILRDLEPLAVIVHGVVLGHDSLLLHTQNLGQGRADPRDEGGAGFGGWHRKAPVVGGEKLRGQILVGRRHLRDPGEGQLFG